MLNALSSRSPVSRERTREPSVEEVRELVERACATIAPAWPLDRFITVNPLWERTSKPLPLVAGELAALSGATMLMPRAYYREAWRDGRLRREHLREVIARRGADVSVDDIVARTSADESAPPRRQSLADVMDALSPRDTLSWSEIILGSISQVVASYFDEGQAQLAPSRKGGLYATFRRHALEDHAPDILMDAPHAHELAAMLPETAEEAVRVAIAELAIPPEHRETYLASLLLGVNGWASYCAYLRWQARLASSADGHIAELLGVRAAWDILLFRLAGARLGGAWRRAVDAWPTADRACLRARAEDWLLQEALELAHQQAIAKDLSRSRPVRRGTVRFQTVFCIDVRSEVMRRAIEAASEATETLGFAGFFGLPIAYTPRGAETSRPQLPGLLSPKYCVEDVGAADVAVKRGARLGAHRAFQDFRTGAVSSFAFVDALGLRYVASLLRETWGAPSAPGEHEQAGLRPSEVRAQKPRLTGALDGSAVSPEDRARLAEGMLRGMSLTRGWAPLVLLVGHGSSTRNNPHGAGLDCGACCGQSGEVNARVAASLLNDASVREILVSRGLSLPESTRFVAALHDTTTDEIRLFDEGELPASHARDLEELRGVLASASRAARRERAPSLGLDGLDDVALERALRGRATNWAEVRPEWGLARNASFVVAPRERTRGLDLAGRTFLHEYRFEEDQDGSVLELIMTAPMVVTHWINFQYYASTVDNARYGSGNKVLHNVVGGHLGVFEGNGGDLRVGLPMQCLHDGEAWYHEPLRLSVFIEAPREAIDGVLARHAKVAELVAHGFLHLLQIDPSGAVHARLGAGWHRVAADPT